VIYSIDPTRQLIRTACVRPLTFAQVIDHFRQLNEDPACSGRLDVLLDVTDVDSLPDSSQLGEVGTAMIAIRKKVRFGSCAIVADLVRNDASIRGQGGRLFRGDSCVSRDG
jgi:hypothetical protein